MGSACYYLNDQCTQNFKISMEASRLARPYPVEFSSLNGTTLRNVEVLFRLGRKILRVCVNVSLTGILSLLLEPVELVQLLLKSLNTPADLLSQLCQSISLILRLYACSTSTILSAKTLEDASQNF